MKSRTKRVVSRVRQVRRELAYAQRRLFEIRTGIPVPSSERPKISRTVEELERLLAA